MRDREKRAEEQNWDLLKVILHLWLCEKAGQISAGYMYRHIDMCVLMERHDDEFDGLRLNKWRNMQINLST